MRSNLWPLAGSNLIAFAFGLASGLFLQRSAEKRAGRKRLSENVLRPLRIQLAEIESEVRARKRPSHWDANSWRAINTSGDILRIKRPLRDTLQNLYDDKFPKYDRAWQAASESLNRRIQGWDRTYGQTSHSPITSWAVPWWDFLNADVCVPPYTEFGEVRVLRLWNSFMDSLRLQELGVTLGRFLEERWSEVQSDTALRQCKSLRSDILKEVPTAIRLLDRSTGD